MSNETLPPVPPAPTSPMGAPATPAVATAPPAAPEVPAAAQAPAAPSAPPAPPAINQAAPEVPAAPPAPQQPVQAQAAPQGPQATQQPAQAVVPAQPTAMAVAGANPLTQQAESMGFAGLNFNSYGAVTVVSLYQGSFRKGEESLGQSFLCKITGSRPKWLYTASKLANSFDDPDKKILYTYDRATNANNQEETIEEFERAAHAAGQQVNAKMYHEVSAILENGENVNMSIPDLGSGGALAGFIANCVAQGLNPTEITTRVKVGNQVKNKRGIGFTPWDFEIASREPLQITYSGDE